MTNVAKGKIGERLAAALFLNYGFEVYFTNVDLKQTDLIVVHPSLMKKYRIQVKSTLLNSFRIQKSRTKVDYYLLVNYSFNHKKSNQIDYWLFPDEEISRLVVDAKKEKNIKDIILKIDHTNWSNFYKFNYLGLSQIRPEKHVLGKLGENLVIAFLLHNGYQVYECIADDMGIDLVSVKNNSNNFVQVKTSWDSFNFPGVKNDRIKIKPNYYFWFITGIKNDSEDKLFYEIHSEVVANNAYIGRGFYLNKNLRKDEYLKTKIHFGS